jgi:glucuronoarabinoxylan endo-1,4-beta-xylanase
LPIVAPETQDWKTFPGFANAMLADPAAAAYVGPLATHAYGGTSAYAFPAAGHSLWVSEVSGSGSADPGMDSGLWAAEKVHESLVSGVNVFHWWWLTPGGKDDRSGLTEQGQLTRRAWAIANWSRFVRPGFVRVNATAKPQANVLASAFADPETGRLVVVAINEGDGALAQSFSVTGGAVPATVTPWITSDELALVAQEPIEVTDGAFAYTLPAKSVTSFVTN